MYDVLTFLNLVSACCGVESNFDATFSQQFTFIFLSLKSLLYFSYKQTYFCTSSIKISVLITLEAFLILSFGFSVLSVISLSIFVNVPQSVNVAIAVAVTNASWDNFESLMVFLGLSSVFPYNVWVFQGRRSFLKLCDPQRPTKTIWKLGFNVYLVKGHVKIILLPVIALSFPHFCPKLEQTLHIHQGQHS